MFGDVNIEVYGGVEDGGEVGDIGGVVHPGWPHPQVWRLQSKSFEKFRMFRKNLSDKFTPQESLDLKATLKVITSVWESFQTWRIYLLYEKIPKY